MIVVTGGAGFIGSVIVWKLNQMGLKDILVVDQKAKNSDKWKNIAKRQFTGYLESDEFLTQLESGKLQNIKTIFHMGACSDTTEKDKEYLRRNNSGYTERIAQWCLSNKAYLCYASSAATYGDGELGFSDRDDLTPKLKPLNLYGQSKLDFDNWVLQHGHEKKLVGIRFFNVYGPNEYHKGAMRSLAQKGFEQVMQQGELKLFKSYLKEYPDGGQKRDFIYVKDAVDVLIWLYQNQKHTGIFNLGTGKAQSWNDMADALFKACNKPKNIQYIEMPDSIKNQYQYFTEASLDKLKKTGCPVQFRNLEAGVADYAKNHLATADRFL